MKQSEHREKPIKRRRVQRNRRAEDRKIVKMCIRDRHGTPHQTLPLGGHVHFRYISNTIVLSPYTEQRTL